MDVNTVKIERTKPKMDEWVRKRKGRKRRKKTTDELISKIKFLRDQGYTFSQIDSELRISHSSEKIKRMEEINHD